MATLVTLANGTVIDDTEVYAKHTDTSTITVSLPQITASGAGTADVAPEATCTIACEDAGTVIVLDYNGRRAGIVGPYQAVAFRSLNTNQDWITEPVARMIQMTADNTIAAGAATPTLGTAAPITAGPPSSYLKCIQADGTVGVILVWPFA